MDSFEARGRFAAARHAVLGTADAAGMPHLVPVTYAVASDLVLIAVDHKPKRGTDLKRLRNVAQNPAVSLLAEHYSDDWSALWWVRADGTAAVTDFAAADPEWLPLFQARYPQYTAVPPAGKLLVVSVDRWSGWSAAA